MDLKVSYPCKRDQIMFLNYIRPFLKKKKNSNGFSKAKCHLPYYLLPKKKSEMITAMS